MANKYRYYLAEADEANEDGVDDGFQAANSNENNNEGDPNATEDAPAEDDNTEETDPNGEGEEPSPDGEEDENFDIDAEDDGEGEEDTEGGDDPNTGGEEESTEEETAPGSLKGLDASIYDSLDPAEQKMKIKELRQMYAELFASCKNISDRLNMISLDDDDATLQIRRASSMVYSLKDMISNYLLNIFDTKSYIENDIMFNRYLSVLNQVKELTNDTKKMFFSDSEEG